MTTEEALKQLQDQQALTVKVQRLTLEGKWDEARIHLDAIDPANAGRWTNVAFPKAP